MAKISIGCGVAVNVGVRLGSGVGVNTGLSVGKTSTVVVPVLSCATADASTPGLLVALPSSFRATFVQPLIIIENIIIRDRI
jgi:hypothetical protein